MNEHAHSKVRMANLGPLHELFLNVCPPNEVGMRSISILAEAIGYTPPGLYKIIRKGTVSPKAVGKMLDVHMSWWDALSGPEKEEAHKSNPDLPYTLEAFHTYVYS